MATRVHGKDADFSFNGQTIESELSSITMNAAAPEAEITAFDDVWQNYLAGKKNITYDLTGTLDMAANSAEQAIVEQVGSGNVTTLFDITGSGPNTNDPEYTCTSSGLTGTLVRSVSITMPVGDKAGFSASLQNSGATTRNVTP
ncbi:hypothetical protein LCGC14_1504950 [marine sediment metagenome]|uniref:Uncharacterized protein n=1 Tax=marine sediment metagenome TaxID=412755 RepID=A0A0F9LIA1_9ZZZZ